MSLPRRRPHPRRPLPPLVRHGGVVPALQPSVADVSRETTDSEQPRGLPKDMVARLEALTAVWEREVRIGGAGPDATLLYSAPKPSVPVPAPRTLEEPPDLAPLPVPDLASDEPAGVPDVSADAPPAPTGPPRVIRDWSSRQDDASRGFDVSDRLTRRVPLQDRIWETGPIFDQGSTPPLSLRDASGCVGMATAAAGNVLHLASISEYLHADPSSLLSKDDALALYDRAQELDHLAGKAYAGTSVLAGMKAGQEAGLWSSYLWAFGTRDIAQALLQVGPVVVGIPWYTGMETPDGHGVVRPTGEEADGHCLALVGLQMSVGGKGGPWFVAQQSRGTQTGDGGLIRLHHRDLTALLRGVGEAAIPVPPGGVS